MGKDSPTLYSHIIIHYQSALESQGRDLEARAVEKCCLLVCSIIQYIFLYAQEHLPRDASIYSGPGLPTSMTNTENVPQACSQACLVEASFQLSPSSYETFAYVRLIKTQVIPITETKMTFL